MSKKSSYSKIFEHPDKDEILNKLLLQMPLKDVYQWLKSKYSTASEAKFVISEKMLKEFQDDYLNIYQIVQKDLHKTKDALANNSTNDLNLSLQGSAYKDIMLKTANKQLDVREVIAKLCIAIETRFAQVFDEIQSDPGNINTKIDRLLIDYTEVLGNILEKFYKFTEEPSTQTIQHNVTLQVVDQHILVLQEATREVLEEIDLSASMLFMEKFNEKISKLKMPEKGVASNIDMQLAETKLLSETINKKINE